MLQKMDIQSRIAFLIVLLLCGFAMVIVFQGRQRVDWCRLEYPQYVVKGEKLRIKLEVLRELPQAQLKIDLHWTDKDRSGFFTYSRQSYSAVEGGEFVYELPIRKEAPYETVFPVVFLSPSGNWGDSIKRAAGQPVWLKNKASDDNYRVSRSERPYVMGYEEVIDYQDPGAIRFYSEILLYFMALVLLVFIVLYANKKKTSILVKSLLLFVAFVFLTLLILRLSGFDQRLSSFLRRVFRVSQVYHSRRILQRLGLVAVGGGWLVAMFFVLRYRFFEFTFKLILLFSSFIMFLSAARYVSLHSFDRFFNTYFFSFSVFFILEVLLFLGLFISGLLYYKQLKNIKSN